MFNGIPRAIGTFIHEGINGVARASSKAYAEQQDESLRQMAQLRVATVAGMVGNLFFASLGLMAPFILAVPIIFVSLVGLYGSFNIYHVAKNISDIIATPTRYVTEKGVRDKMLKNTVCFDAFVDLYLAEVKAQHTKNS